MERARDLQDGGMFNDVGDKAMVGQNQQNDPVKPPKFKR